MTGAPYNHSQSPPSQQPPYPVYASSPSKNRHPFYASNDPHQQYPQHPPQTPPTFSHAPAAPANLSASPHYAHATPSMPATLPPLNGGDQAPGGIQYHGVHSSASGSAPAPAPPFSLPRPYSGSMMSGNGASPPYAHSTPSHSHPSRPDPASATQSPPRKDADPAFSRTGNGPPAFSISREPPPPSPKEAAKPARAADPMSFASILSGPTDEAPQKSSPPPAPSGQLPPAPAAPVSPTPASIAPVEPKPNEPEPEPVSTPTRAPAPAQPKAEEKQPPKERRRPRRTVEQEPPLGEFSPAAPNGVAAADSLKKPASTRPPPPSGRTLTERDVEVLHKITAEIENEDKSDVDAPGFEAELERYISKGRKRALNTERSEGIRRKRRRQDFLVKLGKSFEKQALGGSERFKLSHEPAVVSEVQAKEVQDEKERKKDMQRKRRRENTIRLETQRFLDAELKANEVPDAVIKAKYLREAERAQKKIKSTKRALEGATAPEEISEVTPLAPNLEGGTTSSFHIGRSSPSRRKSGRAGAASASRPKKSKEQKQAEKEAAEAAYAAMENDEPLPSSLLLDDPRKEWLKKEGKEGTPMSIAAPTYDSKGYNQIYEQIWRDIARKDIPKVYRIKAMSLGTRQENLRKTAQLASKQSRKWQERTNKSTKDTQARAKRTMREMTTFWKRNEREERDLRRLAEKQEIESAKKAEADREANRQRRKLNFLISQTELYSHFIGRKIKGAEADEAGDTAVDGSNETVQPGKPQDHTVNLPPSVAKPGAKVTNFEDLDFDADDETALQQAAMANAQNAVQEAQDRARAFNNAADQQQQQQQQEEKEEEENKMAAFDEGELNFQNPTSLGDIEISQPTMLTTQLKEYQLKGLNWLVNLYEQGINGILADEMGLGKTIQSISVMGYLAEYHNIWGPFLVIAPASTLHNWQQEITKFVPNIKVLPYWGNSKDRKILRKFWDRKHITYTRDSEFHVLVTSYQLVVLDAQYFQKVKWQYMILDEAQAIKSSQSSRWKNLLGFHCRNRLLLTGTPIQNNMQELWALLHFIMPTLFDSHDEFSEWFSKDIESHAQSNTKLNEDQLRRLHMILKPFMLRRVKKHVQQELGDKVEKDIFCDLTYRQRAYYANLRNRVSIMDLIERAAVGDEADSTTLMNLVMQFRKVCNHPDLFERAETKSPFSLAHFAETASFVREGPHVDFVYSTRNRIEYDLPRLLCGPAGRIDMAGSDNQQAGFRNKYLGHLMNIWTPENIKRSEQEHAAFSFLRFVDTSPGEAYEISRHGVFERAYGRWGTATDRLARIKEAYEKDADGDDVNSVLSHSMLNIVDRNGRGGGAAAVENVDKEDGSSLLQGLMTVSRSTFERDGLSVIEPCASPAVSAPFIPISCSAQGIYTEMKDHFFNVPVRHALFDRPTTRMDEQILEQQVDPSLYNRTPPLLPEPISQKGRYTHIEVPSMHRFVTDSGKLAKLDELLRELKAGGHRVLLYFQMTRMIDLMEEYLTYRNYKYCRLDGSTKLEDRRDTVADFQQRPEIFVFLLSTRAGGLGINLTAADTVIFYDSDWNPTIDSQAMDRAHRLGQTRQVTVYRLITRNTIEERIRKRALQKEEVQRVVITGGAAGGVDFNTRNRESRTKDIAMWLADDEQVELIEQREKEALDRGEVFGGAPKGGKKATQQQKKKKKDLTLDDMYHEGEGNFDDANAAKQSGAATPLSGGGDVGTPGSTPVPKRGRGGRGGSTKGTSKRAKTTKERLRLIDGDGGLS